MKERNKVESKMLKDKKLLVKFTESMLKYKK